MRTIYDAIFDATNLDEGKSLFEFDGDVKYIISKIDNHYVFSIPLENKIDDINHKFVGMKLKNDTFILGDEKFECLSLFIKDNSNIEMIVTVGRNFLCKENRDKIMLNPNEWADDWRNIFGDTLRKYMISDVLAELFVLKLLYKKDKTFRWQGPLAGTYDIVGKDKVVEVKSTTHKSLFVVSINSEHQINFNVNEDLYLVRLEKKPYAESINSVKKELSEMGYDENDLNELLFLKGYNHGDNKLNETFEILDVYKYCVNENNFPKLSIKDLNDKTTSKNIIGYTLKLDLSTIKNEKVW